MGELNIKTIEKLIYGLPDSRICKVASKVTVISDNGTEIVLKDRGLEINKKIFITEDIDYGYLDNVVKEIDGYEVVITSEVYRNSEVRKLLSEI